MSGCQNRYIRLAASGHKWVDHERRRFTTSYGISYTDREEHEPIPGSADARQDKLDTIFKTALVIKF